MNKKLTKTALSAKVGKIAIIAAMVLAMFVVGMMPTIMSVYAAGGTSIDLTAANSVMDIVVEIVGTAALYIGIIICLWGIFQIVLAFRREDSEGISKQITTVIVGAVLCAFGGLAENLYQSLIGS